MRTDQQRFDDFVRHVINMHNEEGDRLTQRIEISRQEEEFAKKHPIRDLFRSLGKGGYVPPPPHILPPIPPAIERRAEELGLI